MKKFFEEATIEMVKLAAANDVIASSGGDSKSTGSGGDDGIAGEADPF